MFTVLKNITYRHLFLAQVIALIGTGLITIALALLAYDMAGEKAAQVLGIALAIKMIAYIAVAPVASAFAERLPRKKVLVGLDIIRALTALCLPFVTQIWQIYLLIFILQSASAAFTPTFQATIPDVLPDEKDYTNALSLSRLAYDLENIISPMLAGLLLTVISYNNLFLGTVIGFIGSALFVVSAKLPVAKIPEFKGIYSRIKQGAKIYFNTPRLKALLALNLAIASASAVVIVNTVVLVQSTFKLTEHATTWAFGLFGLGSMLLAFILPKVLDKFNDRTVIDKFNSGNGTRLTRASNVIDNFVEVKDNIAKAKRRKTNNEFYTKENYEHKNYAPISTNNVSDNLFKETSKLAGKDGYYISFVWQNSIPSYILPGMMTKILYLDEGIVRTVEGCVIKAHHAIHPEEAGMMGNRYLTQSGITVFIDTKAVDPERLYNE